MLNLLPGRYRFSVVACNEDGTWSSTGPSFSFDLRPHFYQTMLFRVGCVAGLMLLAAMIVFIRVRQVMRVNQLEGPGRRAARPSW